MKADSPSLLRKRQVKRRCSNTEVNPAHLAPTLPATEEWIAPAAVWVPLNG